MMRKPVATQERHPGTPAPEDRSAGRGRAAARHWRLAPVLLLGLVLPAAAAPGEGLPSWREAEFTATKFLLRAGTTVRVERVAAADIAGALRPAPQGEPLPVPAAGLLRVSLSSSLPFGRTETTSVLLDPESGAAYQTEKTNHGRRHYRKVSRFTPQGIFTWRTSPDNDGEAAGTPAGWSRLRTELEAPDRNLPPGAVLTDAYALLVLLSSQPWQRQGETRTAHILSEGRLVELTFTAGGLTTMAATFDEETSGGRRRRSGTPVVRPVVVTGRAVAGGEEGRGVDLGFLGMRGALTVVLEHDTGIPLEVSGRADRVGNLVVRLTRVTLP